MKRILSLLFFVILTLYAKASDDTKAISLYPVPVKSSVLNVRLEKANMGIAKVELRNLIGRKLQEKEFKPGENVIRFEGMDTYSNGLYLVVAKDLNDKVIEISKFIITR